MPPSKVSCPWFPFKTSSPDLPSKIFLLSSPEIVSFTELPITFSTSISVSFSSVAENASSLFESIVAITKVSDKLTFTADEEYE